LSWREQDIQRKKSPLDEEEKTELSSKTAKTEGCDSTSLTCKLDATGNLFSRFFFKLQCLSLSNGLSIRERIHSLLGSDISHHQEKKFLSFVGRTRKNNKTHTTDRSASSSLEEEMSRVKDAAKRDTKRQSLLRFKRNVYGNWCLLFSLFVGETDIYKFALLYHSRRSSSQFRVRFQERNVTYRVRASLSIDGKPTGRIAFFPPVLENWKRQEENINKIFTALSSCLFILSSSRTKNNSSEERNEDRGFLRYSDKAREFSRKKSIEEEFLDRKRREISSQDFRVVLLFLVVVASSHHRQSYFRA
jgi:hypothetical protein